MIDQFGSLVKLHVFSWPSIHITAVLFALFSLLIVTTITDIKIIDLKLIEVNFEIKCQLTENIFSELELN